jgi:hypothetical protein
MRFWRSGDNFSTMSFIGMAIFFSGDVIITSYVINLVNKTNVFWTFISLSFAEEAMI